MTWKYLAHIFSPVWKMSILYVYDQRNEFRAAVVRLGSIEALKLYDKV